MKCGIEVLAVTIAALIITTKNLTNTIQVCTFNCCPLDPKYFITNLKPIDEFINRTSNLDPSEAH